MEDRTKVLACKEAKKTNKEIRDSIIQDLTARVLTMSEPLVAVIWLGMDLSRDIKKWFKGEIDDCALLESITENGGACAVGVGAASLAVTAVAGAIGGLVGGPIGLGIGILMGGIVGGLSSYATKKVVKCINTGLKSFFGVPRDQAVREAFRFLNLDYDAQAADVTRAYKRLALLYHPDHGGDHELFIKLAAAVDIIRQHRDSRVQNVVELREQCMKELMDDERLEAVCDGCHLKISDFDEYESRRWMRCRDPECQEGRRNLFSICGGCVGKEWNRLRCFRGHSLSF